MKLTRTDRSEAKRFARRAVDRTQSLGSRQQARDLLLNNLLAIPDGSVPTQYLLPFGGLTTPNTDEAVLAWSKA